MKKWLIVYSSVTGNTKQIAEAIYNGFGEDMADIFAIRDKFNLEDYDNIAVGYWLTRGEPDKMVQELLKKLNNKTVILFQTQGAELNSEHSITAFARAASYLGENCKVLGTFASQGKINPAMLERRKMLIKMILMQRHLVILNVGKKRQCILMKKIFLEQKNLLRPCNEK